MLQGGIFEVAIGLIFVFVLLALLVTQINTLISNLFKWRSKQLKQGIENLISDKRLQAEVFIHPLVNLVDKSDLMLLSLQVNDEKLADEISETSPSNVTYISPETFAEAMTSILIARSTADLYGPIQNSLVGIDPTDEKYRVLDALRDLQTELNNENLEALENAIQNLPNNAEALAAYQKMVETLGRIRGSSADLLPLLNGINTIKVPALREALKIILVTAENMKEAQGKIEKWFNDGMERTSEAFKARMQWVSFAIAIILVLVLNVDTFYLGRTLWEDQELRTAVAEAARDYEQFSSVDVLPQPPTAEDDEAITEGESSLEHEEDPTVSELAAQNLRDLEAVEQTVQQLLELQLPIGWEYQEVTDEMIETARALGLQDPRDSARNVWNLLPWNNEGWLMMSIQKLIGLAVSAIAAAQGAPFWFDLLKKLTKP